jgi:hypothetical protein
VEKERHLFEVINLIVTFVAMYRESFLIQNGGLIPVLGPSPEITTSTCLLGAIEYV